MFNAHSKTLLIATSNPGKFREIMEVVHELPFNIFSSTSLCLNNDVVEDGETYEENAEKKARFYFQQIRARGAGGVGGGDGAAGAVDGNNVAGAIGAVGRSNAGGVNNAAGVSDAGGVVDARRLPVDFVLAEDSGIVVDALKGQLGVKTRRFGAGEKASDEEWIEYFLDVLKDVPANKRTARFICHAALLNGEGEIYMFSGVTEGEITFELQAPLYRGLPISSCFRPVGFDKVYAALSVEEKNRVSHRGKAMHEVKSFLLKNSSL
jgi:XTP/dITP diphosphohydrolase